MKEKEQPEIPVGFYHVPEYKFQISQQEFAILEQFKNIFELPVSIINNMKQKAIVEKGIIPVYKDDVVDNKINDSFFERHSLPKQGAE